MKLEQDHQYIFVGTQHAVTSTNTASIEDNVSQWSWLIFYWYFTLKNLFLATVYQEHSGLLNLMGRELFDSYN